MELRAGGPLAHPSDAFNGHSACQPQLSLAHRHCGPMPSAPSAPPCCGEAFPTVKRSTQTARPGSIDAAMSNQSEVRLG
jgi:hypothetical protein